MIARKEIFQQVKVALGRSRIVGLIGPRQCGKTTLARNIVSTESINYFDLENPIDLTRLGQPVLSLESLEGIVVIDEVQRYPEIFPVLRVLVDRESQPATFLILGSANPLLLKQASESLAGRIEYIEMTPFNSRELSASPYLKYHWLRGGFPRSLLAKCSEDSYIWRENFIRTLLERDIPNLGITIPAMTLRRFWTMLAHYHGQIFNASEIAKSMGVNQTTAVNYLDLLQAVFMIRVLRPWHQNLKKRQIKRPKIYFRDSGLLHSLLAIKDKKTLFSHPKYGYSWEGYALEEVINCNNPDEVYFWSTHNGAELDLLMIKDGKKIGVEFKIQDAPRLTRSMNIAMRDLHLDYLYVIYSGNKSYPLGDNILVKPLSTGHNYLCDF